MNKKVLTSFLIAVTLIVGYLTFDSINSEINFRKKVAEVDQLVIERLETLRKIQLAYKEVNGEYADNFDKLFNFMNNGKYFKLKTVGENDGDVNNSKTDTIFVNPKVGVLGLTQESNINYLKMIPPTDTAIFKINAGKITQNNVLVPVFEISDPHPFNKGEKPKKVGDMYNAVTTGNWK